MNDGQAWRQSVSNPLRSPLPGRAIVVVTGMPEVALDKGFWLCLPGAKHDRAVNVSVPVISPLRAVSRHHNVMLY